MQHDLPLLLNITVALLAAFVGGLLARRLKLPAMVGYLLAGVAIGPFTPGFIGDLFTIQQLAELGVIFLLFDVGLHFSLRDLWAVRDTVRVTPMMGRIRIAFDAANPGRWPFHCHNLYHMITGMMTEFRYEGIAA